MYRKLGLAMVCLLNLTLGTVQALAFVHNSPPTLPPRGDLSGEVVLATEQGVVLALANGTVCEIRFSPDCQITLNGSAAEPAALNPVMAECNVEVSVALSNGQAVMVHGFYYCVEARIRAVEGKEVLFTLLDFPDTGFWAAWPKANTLPAIGSVYLVRLNITGGVKQGQLLATPEGEQSELPNNFTRVVN